MFSELGKKMGLVEKQFDPNQCKVQLKLAITRLKLQKTKKENNIKNQKREIAELLKLGKDESARIKVETIIREDFLIEAFDILELFCELLVTRLGVIQISRECPEDIKEAVCSLIYAAPRIEVKELSLIRDQLGLKYGKEFVLDTMSNKDNCVNSRIVHKLSVQAPENYLVYQYLNEIAKSHNLDWKAEIHPPMNPTHLESEYSQVHSFPSQGPIISPFPNFTHNHQQQQPSFPSIPQFSSNNPSFPAVPNIPSNNNPTFPSVPNFPSNQFTSGPSPDNKKTSGQPDFPSVPNIPSNNNPTFPSVPTFKQPTNNQLPSFPSPPSQLNFPTPPSNSHDVPPNFPSIPTFPSYPPSFSSERLDETDETNNNFDDLTAR
eukprot:TRINITY_DN3716_c0_g1_i4.p1 TRINITY_DN3716_c0_g1~~TRINITY_DN3716_c0_g1_i4.p1  ORF type:complete len:376 (+),score=99.45 TRINITY_DN3716_c0_g1_i4:214-1341(+)